MTPESIVAIHEVVKLGEERASKSLGIDDLFHNYGIALAITLGTLGTGLPTSSLTLEILSKVFTGLATAIFAIERSLEFGARWRFHRTIRNNYRKIQVRLKIAEAKSENAVEQEKLVQECVVMLDKVLDQDCGIPGTGMPSISGAATT